MEIQTKQLHRLIFSLIFCLFIPSVAYANVIWPALEISNKLLSPAPIILGLIVELFAVKAITKFSLKKSIIVTLIMNLVSTAIGIFAIPIAGIVWEIWHVLPLIVTSHEPTGSIEISFWIAASILLAAISSFIIWLLAKNLINNKIGIKAYFCILVSVTAILLFVGTFEMRHGTFNLPNIICSVILAAFVSTVFEWLVIRFLFKKSIGNSGFAWLSIANLASTAMAWILTILEPVQY